MRLLKCLTVLFQHLECIWQFYSLFCFAWFLRTDEQQNESSLSVNDLTASWGLLTGLFICRLCMVECNYHQSSTSIKYQQYKQTKG